MTKIEARTPKGFRDFLGSEAKQRASLIEIFSKTFERFGFEPLFTPALEYAEVLNGKYGEEEKLIYEFEDRGGRMVALRYDQTVPLARVVANYPSLVKPYRRYQIQPVWRAENTQKGRYREFLQVDIDTIGSSSLLAEADTIATIVTAMEELGFKNFNLRINDREIFSGLTSKVISTIDKLEKIGEAGVISILKTDGYSEGQCKEILKRVRESKPTSSINELFNLLEKMKIRKDVFSFDPTLARGLDYYSGLIFELEVEGYGAGSVGGGGRYDRLIGLFADSSLPAVGFSFGFDRIVEAATELKIIQNEISVTKVLVTIFNSELLPFSIETLNELRRQKINTEIYLDPETKLDKQIKYADQKKIPFVVLVGPEEIKNKTVTVKKLSNGEQKQMKISKIKTFIEEKRRL
jgi:histidyl-tRNA synthetase